MSDLSAVVPLLTFALSFLLLRSSAGAGREVPGWRECWLAACVIWGIAVVGLTEFLSVFRSLSFPWLLSAWGSLATVLILLYFRRTVAARPRGYPPTLSGQLSVLDRLLLASALFLVALPGMTALIAPPNNWDSMTYHMSRIMHWIQHGSVEHYPTNVTRQLFLTPWAEFAVLQFQLLTRGDRLANLVQWMSMISSMCGVSLITKHLGGDVPTQLAAAVIAGAIPMGILQASSTQNDYVGAFWLVCFAHYVIRLTRDPRASSNPSLPVLAGASLGLALLTKGTAYLFGLPLLAWAVFASLRSRSFRALRMTAAVVLVAIVLNTGHFARNLTVFGSVLGPEAETRYLANDVINGPVFISNVLRNAGLHLEAPSWRVNAATMKVIVSAHELLDIDMNDPRTSYGGGQGEFRFDLDKPLLHEDLAGNGLHMVLSLLAIASAVLLPRSARWPHVRWYAFAICGAFGLFCAYLKWQPWGSRLQLPLFVLATPLIAVMALRVIGRSGAKIVAVVAAVAALPWLLSNQSRPLIGEASLFTMRRDDLYFMNRPSLSTVYRRATEQIRLTGCRQVGLALGSNDWEYPFWILLDDQDRKPGWIGHVGVMNDSAVTRRDSGTGATESCAVIALDSADGFALASLEKVYRKKWREAPVTVFAGLRGPDS